MAARGGLLTGLVTAALWAAWGRPAVLPGVVFGGLATAIQVAADRIVRPGPGPFPRHWGVAVGLRVAGVGVFAVAATVAPDTFPPVPTALGYLGVLVPLLFVEGWLGR